MPTVTSTTKVDKKISKKSVKKILNVFFNSKKSKQVCQSSQKI